MNRTLLLLLTSVTLSVAGIMDSYHLYWAQHYAHTGQYKKAFIHYQSVNPKEDTLHYNLGNILYRQGRYQEAINHYIVISSASLQHAKYHNIANALMQLGALERAIVFYRNAQKFSSHSDTAYNLALAEGLLREAQSAEQRKALRESNETMQLRDGSEKIERFKEDNGTDDLKDAPTPERITKRDNASGLRSRHKNDLINTATPAESNQSLFIDIERENQRLKEEKWQAYFKKRKLKTLLIPLENEAKTTGDQHDPYPY